MQIRQRIPGKENIPEGFAFKKKVYTPARLFLPSFWSIRVFLSGIPLAIRVSSLLAFIRPQGVGAGAEAATQGSDSSAARHAFGLRRCLFFSALSCSPGQPPKQFYNLAAGTKLPFPLLIAKFLRQLIAHPYLQESKNQLLC